jgi:hypothetical protein
MRASHRMSNRWIPFGHPRFRGGPETPRRRWSRWIGDSCRLRGNDMRERLPSECRRVAGPEAQGHDGRDFSSVRHSRMGRSPAHADSNLRGCRWLRRASGDTCPAKRASSVIFEPPHPDRPGVGVDAAGAGPGTGRVEIAGPGENPQFLEPHLPDGRVEE